MFHTRPGPLDALRPMVASDYAPFLWSEGFGLGGKLDQAIIARSAEVKAALYGGQVFVIVPIYVTSICEEQCLYCKNAGRPCTRRPVLKYAGRKAEPTV